LLNEKDFLANSRLISPHFDLKTALNCDSCKCRPAARTIVTVSQGRRAIALCAYAKRQKHRALRKTKGRTAPEGQGMTNGVLPKDSYGHAYEEEPTFGVEPQHRWSIGRSTSNIIGTQHRQQPVRLLPAIRMFQPSAPLRLPTQTSLSFHSQFCHANNLLMALIYKYSLVCAECPTNLITHVTLSSGDNEARSQVCRSR
jgi:hypothetical protein